MASNTTASTNKRARAHSNMGRKRKNRDSKKSTPSTAELFAALGEPGKPAPAHVAKKATTKATAKPAAKPAAKSAP